VAVDEKGEAYHMEQRKYEKLIVSGIREGLDLPWKEVGPRRRIAWLDDSVIEGSFYVDCAWYCPGEWKDEPAVDAHTHSFDEVIGFFGTDPENPEELGGEIELWLGDEKYVFTKSFLVYVPKGLSHCPLIVRKVYRPIFHFTTGPGGKYDRRST